MGKGNRDGEWEWGNEGWEREKKGKEGANVKRQNANPNANATQCNATRRGKKEGSRNEIEDDATVLSTNRRQSTNQRSSIHCQPANRRHPTNHRQPSTTDFEQVRSKPDGPARTHARGCTREPAARRCSTPMAQYATRYVMRDPANGDERRKKDETRNTKKQGNGKRRNGYANAKAEASAQCLVHGSATHLRRGEGKTKQRNGEKEK